mmetsp:Transcript_24685/g.46363  ORF Transcript_24685/g.46363 Transcript_24685/m.46363 type:complete len:239 (+) Transcript_24685:338-1054(+)
MPIRLHCVGRPGEQRRCLPGGHLGGAVRQLVPGRRDRDINLPLVHGQLLLGHHYPNDGGIRRHQPIYDVGDDSDGCSAIRRNVSLRIRYGLHHLCRQHRRYDSDAHQEEDRRAERVHDSQGPVRTTQDEDQVALRVPVEEDHDIRRGGNSELPPALPKDGRRLLDEPRLGQECSRASRAWRRLHGDARDEAEAHAAHPGGDGGEEGHGRPRDVLHNRGHPRRLHSRRRRLSQGVPSGG